MSLQLYPGMRKNNVLTLSESNHSLAQLIHNSISHVHHLQKAAVT